MGPLHPHPRPRFHRLPGDHRLAAQAGRCRRARGSRSTPARSWRRGRPACASSGPTGGAATARSPRRPAPAVSRNARRRAGRFPFRRCPPRSRPAGRRRRSPRGRGRRESAGSPDARWRACAGSRSFRHGETIHGGPMPPPAPRRPPSPPTVAAWRAQSPTPAPRPPRPRWPRGIREPGRPPSGGAPPRRAPRDE